MDYSLDGNGDQPGSNPNPNPVMPLPEPDMELKDNRHVSRALIEQVPTQMKAAVYRLYGNVWRVLQYNAEYLVPHLIRNDSVIVKVHAAGVNHIDYKAMRGDLKLVNKSLPLIPGVDVSGVVVQAGLDCKRLRVGVQVYGIAHPKRSGCMSEYVLMRESELAHKPQSIGHIATACLPTVATAAYKALITIGDITKGMKVLVLGGSGGAGTFAIQLAKALGAHVATTCSQKNINFVQSLGADFAIDYETTNWFDLLNGENFDLIYDTVGGVESWDKAAQVLSPTGRFVTIVGDVEERLTVKGVLKKGASVVNRKFWGLFGSCKYHTVEAKGNFEILESIRPLLDAGSVQAVIDRIYPLEKVHAAIQHIQSGRTRGKVVVAIIPDEKLPRQLYLDEANPMDYDDPSLAVKEIDEASEASKAAMSTIIGEREANLE